MADSLSCSFFTHNIHRNAIVNVVTFKMTCNVFSKLFTIAFSAANLLWNNLLEPVGNKSDNAPPVLLRSFHCPTRERPYIFTAKNTKMYFETGRQDFKL